MITAHNSDTGADRAEGPGRSQVDKNIVYDIGPVSPDVEIKRQGWLQLQVKFWSKYHAKVRGGKGCGDWTGEK